MPIIDDPSEQYPAIFSEFEQVVHRVKRSRGRPGLLPSQFGRGSTRDRIFSSQQVSPLKPSRPGEEQPTFEGINLRHKRWFTQLRRLVAYTNHVKYDRAELQAREHKFRLWRAILLAPGFGKGFSFWWPSRATQHESAPLLIPSHAPDLVMATAILAAFRLEFQACDAMLAQQRHERNAKRYETDVNQIFRDVRKPSPQPVQLLLAKEKLEVATVVTTGSHGSPTRAHMFP
eukprot:s31_g27.t1